MNRFNNEQLASGVWLIIGAVVAVASVRLDLGSLAAPDTGFMPFLAGLAMCLFASIGLIHGTMGLRRGVGWKTVIGKDVQWRKTLLVLTSLLAYTLLLTRLGFLLSTLFFLGFLFRAVKPQKWPVVVLGSILITACAYLIFEVWIKSQLPKGPWGF